MPTPLEQVISILPTDIVRALSDLTELAALDVANGCVHMAGDNDSEEEHVKVLNQPNNRAVHYVKLITHILILKDHEQLLPEDTVSNFVYDLMQAIIAGNKVVPNVLSERLEAEDQGGDNTEYEVTPEVRESVNALYKLSPDQRDRVYNDATEYLKDQLPKVELDPVVVPMLHATFVMIDEQVAALQHSLDHVKKQKRRDRIEKMLLMARQEIHATMAQILKDNCADITSKKPITVDNAVLLALALMGEVARHGSDKAMEQLLLLDKPQGTC